MANGFPNRTVNNLWATLHELAASLGLFGLLGANQDNTWWIDPVNGSDNVDGRTQGNPKATITNVLLTAVAGEFLMLAPGQYNESPTIAVAKNNLTLIGYRGRGSAYIEPTTEDAGGLVVHGDDVTLINVGIAGEDETSAVALTVTGTRLRAYACKLEGGLTQLTIGPGTIAQITAGTRGKGADSLFDDCEFAWGTNGVNFQGTDYGGVTQIYFRNCRFHDLTATSFTETVGSGGSAAVTYFGLVVRDCVFENDEAGAAPTKWFSINANNANSGIVTGCQFPGTLTSGKNLVSTKVIWTGNLHPAGLSTGQPS